jgi:ATP-binding cassette, subfamily B, bacterial
MMHYGGRGDHFIMRMGDESAKPKLSWALLGRVFSYARPYLFRIVLLLVVILAGTGLGLVTPLLFRDLIDRAIPGGDARRLTLLAVGLIAIPVVNGLLNILQARVNSGIGSGVIFDLRVSLYRHLQRMSLAFFTTNKTGELMSRLNNDVIGAQTAVSSTIVDIVTNLLTVIATLAVMVALEWRLTLLGLLILPAFSLLARSMGKKMRAIARESMERNARMNAIMNETLNISGLLLVKLFGTGETEVGRFGEQAAKVRDNSIRQAVAGGRLFMFMGMATAVTTGVIYLVGGHLAIRGALTVGTIVAFSSYLGQLYGPLRSLTNAPIAFAQSMVSFERVFEVLDLPREIDERPEALTLREVRGELVFEDVSFSYGVDPRHRLSAVKRVGQSDSPVFSHVRGKAEAPAEPVPEPAREAALEGVSFRVEPGALAALVGPSGAGKTTVTYLIPRLYDPSRGRILLDGHDVRDLTFATIASAVGMVTQETYLFHDTIRTNLLYAKPEATESELEEACRAANIHDFIHGLPERYDTLVGERGYRLSGGEKQRVALARVILKNPRVLVLDEATSNLDSRSEALIQDALARVMTGRTSLVIAHRLSTILAADVILVLDRGRIVERGRHAELLAAGGLYAELYRTQFAKAEG